MFLYSLQALGDFHKTPASFKANISGAGIIQQLLIVDTSHFLPHCSENSARAACCRSVLSVHASSVYSFCYQSSVWLRMCGVRVQANCESHT